MAQEGEADTKATSYTTHSVGANIVTSTTRANDRPRTKRAAQSRQAKERVLLTILLLVAQSDFMLILNFVISEVNKCKGHNGKVGSTKCISFEDVDPFSKFELFGVISLIVIRNKSSSLLPSVLSLDSRQLILQV